MSWLVQYWPQDRRRFLSMKPAQLWAIYFERIRRYEKGNHYSANFNRNDRSRSPGSYSDDARGALDDAKRRL